MSKVWTDAECAPFDTPWRSAIINKIVDADTFDVCVTLGFAAKVDTRVRLLREGAFTTPQDPSDDGVNAWEVRGPQRVEGLVARERVLTLLQPGDEVRIFSQKGAKLDGLRRYLAVILVNTIPGGWVSLGDTLLEEGHATAWERS
jgi:endonuclease YncB( thermonuclease family)